MAASSIVLPNGDRVPAQGFTQAAPDGNAVKAQEIVLCDASGNVVGVTSNRLDVNVGAALPAGTNNIGDVDVLTLPAIPAGTNTIGNVGLAPQASGGLSISRLIAAATTNATNAKSSAGQVFGWFVYNNSIAVRYVKLYNKASAPTVGTDVPVITLPLPPGSAANVSFDNGIVFGTGISYATTANLADNDSTAVTANDIILNLFYK